MYYHRHLLNPFTPSSGQNLKFKNMLNFIFFFFQIPPNKQYPAKVLPKRFHLNGHTIGFHPQTQKLALHHVSIIDSGSKGVNKIYSIHVISIKSLAYLHTVT